MKNLKFHVGDRVVVVEQPRNIGPEHLRIGSMGTIVYCYPASGFDYAVEWDEKFKRGYRIYEYDEHGNEVAVTSNYHGWKVEEDRIELVEDTSEIAEISSDVLDNFMAGALI